MEAAYRAGRLNAEHLDLYRSFAARYPFPLDQFQVTAVRAILEADSVIVSAPTGAGKTLIAEFAIFQALARRQRIAYTTPLKALSNQKYADFCRQFGAAEVGILTGDVKVNPRAPVLVMTTEILRNMFYTGGVEGLGYVVLDECHYIGNEGRGTVWEEIIVSAPKEVALVALSATVANIGEIAEWISLVHRPIVVVTNLDRPVPLSYLVADLSGELHAMEAVRQGTVRLDGEGGAIRRQGRARGRWHARPVADPTEVIAGLEERGWLPALYFIFSRAGCERALDEYLAEGKPLLARPQRKEVDATIREAIQESPGMVESSLNQTIFQALGMGVGLHHAGVLPSVKRLVERLFERGLCRVVFATETMSLGIHMPAKTVVLQGLSKRTDRGFRRLTHNELTQMAGRAGRRGIDTEGKCIVALDRRDSLEEALWTVDGPSEPVESQFRLGYGSVTLLLATTSDPATIRRVVESSFGQHQNLKRIRELESETSQTEAALAAVRAYEAPCGDFSRIGRYRQLRQEVEARRRLQGGGTRRRQVALAQAEPGRLVLVRRRGGGGLAAIVSIHSRRGHRVLADALLPHGSLVRIKPANVKKIFWATSPLALPRDWRQRQSGILAELRKLSLSDLLQREEGHGPEAKLAAIECHRCPWGAQSRCDQAWKEIEKLDTRLGQRTEILEALRNAYWQEFCRVVEVLERFDAVKAGALLAKGRLIASLRHDNELLVAETVRRGLLAGASLAEAAALCSCLIEEARSGDGAVVRRFLKQRSRLRKTLRQLETVGEIVLEAQRQHHLGLPCSVQPGFMPAVYRWASGDDDWAGIVENDFGGHEGDLIRAMRRLIDLLRQLAEAPEVLSPLGTLLGQAARAIDRGVVLESALI
ncbi:MAG: DEAD/DEAH box helicase [Candidatus Methylomirabilia bacterium]